MRPGIFLAFVLLLAPLLAPGTALAQADGVQPLDRLLPQIRRTHPGQFFDADGPTAGPGGSQHYHLKWMTPDGRILWLDTDARTGRVLGQAPGRDMFDAPRPPAAPAYEPRGNPRAREDYDGGRDRSDNARGSGYDDRGYNRRDDRSNQDRFQGGQPDARPYGGRQYDNRQQYEGRQDERRQYGGPRFEGRQRDGSQFGGRSFGGGSFGGRSGRDRRDGH